MLPTHSDAANSLGGSFNRAASANRPGFLAGSRGIYRSYSMPSWIVAFDDLVPRSVTIRTAVRMFELVRGTVLADLMFMLFALLSALRCQIPSSAEGALFALALYPNERQAARRLRSIQRSTEVIEGDVKLTNALQLVILRPRMVLCAIGALLRFRPVLRRLHRDGHFLPLCQITKYVACYAVYRQWFRMVRPKAVVISTMTHPECWAIVTCAHQFGVKSIFAAHASLPPGGAAVAPLTDMLLLYSEQCLESCRAVGARYTHVCFWGLEGRTEPIRFSELREGEFVLGLFLTAPVNEEGLVKALRTLVLVNRPKYLLLRPHPIGFLSPDLAHLERDVPGVQLATGRSLTECLAMCDVMLSGNSNVHRDALRAGVPALYVDGIDKSPYDLWQFVRGGFVPETAPDRRIDPAELKAFYNGEWRQHFRRYDASFDEAPELTRSRVEQSLLEFLEG